MVTLVLMPGLDGTGKLFAPFIDALDGALPTRVVTYPHDGPQTCRRLGAFVRDLLPEHGPVILLGESFSGPLAVALATRHPERIAGVILCCSFVQNPRPGLSTWMRLAGNVPAPMPPGALMAHYLLGRWQSRPLRRLLGDAVAGVPGTVLRARLREVAEVNVSAELAQMRMPVLYLRALEDRLVPQAASQLVKSYCPSAEIAAFQGPHCLLQTAPAETAQAVIDFAHRLSSGRSAIETVQAPD